MGNTESEYMIVSKGADCWPLVKIKNTVLIGYAWMRIGVHANGFGLYPGNDRDHPVPYARCKEIIEAYHKQKKTADIITEIRIPYTPIG